MSFFRVCIYDQAAASVVEPVSVRVRSLSRPLRALQTVGHKNVSSAE